MKITTQLRATVIGFFIFGVSNIVSVYINTAGNDGRVVNYAGLVRGGTQRLVKLEMAGKTSDKLILKLDKLVNGLINGDKELGLLPATDRVFISKMREVEGAWKNLKDVITRSRKETEYRNDILTLSEEYFDLTNKAVFAAEEFSQEKAQRLKVIQIIVFGISLIILTSIWIIARNITLTLQRSISTIAISSTQIASAVEEQERTIAQQATSVKQMATTIEELGASSRASAQQAEASARGASQALALAEGGTLSVQHSLDEMATLKEKVGALAEQILRLSEQTNQIGGISGLVGDLANQTNMLALNAAVEAARAGEHGKGFGVVAGEIRKFADQSKKSAQKINALVGDIQSAINTTVMVTDEGTKTVAEGMQLTQGTADSFTGVAGRINNISLNSQQISLNANQQAIAVAEVVYAMNSLTLAAQETVGSITQIKVGTQQLKEAAQNLKAMV